TGRAGHTGPDNDNIAGQRVAHGSTMSHTTRSQKRARVHTALPVRLAGGGSDDSEMGRGRAAVPWRAAGFAQDEGHPRIPHLVKALGGVLDDPGVGAAPLGAGVRQVPYGAVGFKGVL